MFGIFSRKPKVQPQGPAPSPNGPVTPASVASVIVSRSAADIDPASAEAYELVQDVVTFCNEMMNNGLYTRHELPAKALQAYYADYYLAQVNNGGHSQFVGNAKSLLPVVIEHARLGLAAMGATEHLALLEKAAAWVGGHPDEASQQTGFGGGRAQELNALDDPFYAANKAAPMAGLSAKWIRGWPELSIVDDDVHQEALAKSALLNPARPGRLRLKTLNGFQVQMTDQLQVGVGLACGAAGKVKYKIGGGQYFEIDGTSLPAFLVHTGQNETCFGVVSDDFAALYERVVHSAPPVGKPGDPLGLLGSIKDGSFKKFKAPTLGNKLAEIPAATIANVIEFGKRHQAGGAADLLLRKAGAQPSGAVLSAMGMPVAGQETKWIVATKGETFGLSHSTAGSTLSRFGKAAGIAAQATAKEIADHVANTQAAAPDWR